MVNLTLLSTVLAAGQLVSGHAAITQATGDLGGAGSALGIIADTPRDGTGRKPFQQDATAFRGQAADVCGRTLAGGDNDIEKGTAAILAANAAAGNSTQLPQVSAGGKLTMTLHQVNADGAGAYTCMIDATGTGAKWVPITVSTNVDGSARGVNQKGSKTDNVLVADIPAGQTCTGTVAGQSNVCMVRCQNPARAGPFGGCVPVQLANGSGAAAASS
ncbi:uncharacterized protein B0I36DRAFT_250867, partial [Microdochium trichocladiopsis]